MQYPKIACMTFIAAFLLTGCAITETGHSFDLVDDNEYAEALPHAESAARSGSKRAAMLASMLHLSDYQVPRNVKKAQEFYDLALQLEYDRYDQFLDYFTPQIRARILLSDGDDQNDAEATSILRGDRYSEYPPTLRTLALSYAFGKGVEKSLKTSKLLFERAVEEDTEVYSSHYYAWWLAVHPDAAFRDGPRALALMESVMDDEDEAEKATTLDSMAAVYAANDRFEEAVETQDKALKQLRKDIEKYPFFERWRPAFECRAKAYRRETALHYEPAYKPFSDTRSEGCEL